MGLCMKKRSILAAVVSATTASLLGNRQASSTERERDLPIDAASLALFTPTSYEDQKARGFRPRADVQAWPLTLPINWNADPFTDRNWRFHLHAWRMTDPIFNKYVKTGDPAYLEEATIFIRDWHAYHLIAGKSSEFSWYDMAAGIRAIRIAFLEEQISTGKWNPPAADRNILHSLASIHARRLQDENFISHGNHGLFQTVGLDMLCQKFADIPECRNGRKFAAKMFEKISGGQFTEEGIHTENSPQYHRFALTAIEKVGGTDRFDLPALRRKLDLAKEAWPFMVFPDGRVVRVGDSAGYGHSLKVPDPHPVKLSNGKEFAVRDWHESGYIVIRSNPPKQDAMLFVTGMNEVWSGHKHADNLSFELYEHGRQIFVDSGKFGYNKSEVRRYFVSAAAHNTISIKDRPQTPRDVELNGSSLNPLEITDDQFVVTGSAEFPRLGLRQERRLSYEPGRCLTIIDKVTSGEEREFVSTLVLPPDLIPRMTENGFELTLADGTRIVGSVEQRDCRVEAVRGQDEPPLGWISSDYLKKEPTTVVRAICRGKVQTMTWKINLKA